MARFVLVHGSWHGAWCWREVVPRLTERGHEALVIDLPGHGEDCSPIESVTFQDYVHSTIQAVDSSSEDAILVGHSMGGAIINQSAEVGPDRIRALVYVAALMPASGRSMLSYVEAFDPEYLAQILWSPDRRTARIQPEGVRRFLYSQCPAETIESALPLLKPEPVAPYEAPIFTTDANSGKVARYYIECLQDRVVPIALQRAMRAGVHIDGVYSLDTDHAPFFSAPEQLTAILHGIAEIV
jgi:pimeloyl-ACP methyl ester carboxylesterase